MVALDDARFLERANPPEARRRGEANALCQLDVGNAAFGLQFGEQPPID